MKVNVSNKRGTGTFLPWLGVSPASHISTSYCRPWFVRTNVRLYEGVSKSFRTGHLERELQMVQLFATRCSCIAILWVSPVSSAAITLCVASQRVFTVVSVYFPLDSVRKHLDIPPYILFIYVDSNYTQQICVAERFSGKSRRLCARQSYLPLLVGWTGRASYIFVHSLY
jgi:hypothetical protein